MDAVGLRLRKVFSCIAQSRVHAGYCVVATLDVGAVGRLGYRLEIGTLDHRRLVHQHAGVLGIGGLLHDRFERLELAHQQCRHAEAGLPDLVERPSHEIVVAHLLTDDADGAVAVVIGLGRGPHVPQLAQRIAQPVNACQCRIGVVDRWRERPNRDLDQLVHTESRVLGKGPDRSGDLCALQTSRDRVSRFRWPHRGELPVLHQKISRSIGHMHDSVDGRCLPHQQVVPNGLQITTFRSPDHRAGRLDPVDQGRDFRGVFRLVRCGHADVGLFHSEVARQIAGDTGDDEGQLDLDGDVVQEIDEHCQVEQDQ